MASELLRLQWIFAELVPGLLNEATRLGYRYKFGDAKRDARVFGKVGESKGYGHPRSAHKLQLAIDIDLFLEDGTYLQDGTGHDKLHDWWEARGGARRIANDLNHYSFEYQGMR